MTTIPDPVSAQDVAQAPQPGPALWNPNAAANWSLLFTPAFGAYLHMHNWRALGEPGRAATAKGWVVASLIMLVVYLALGLSFPDSRAAHTSTRVLGFAYLLAWYFSAARGQAKFVKEKFGSSYQHKSWWKPLMYGVLALIGFFAAAFIVGFVSGIVNDS
jgi:hypothetical protein